MEEVCYSMIGIFRYMHFKFFDIVEHDQSLKLTSQSLSA